MKLPNGERVELGDKLERYCLNFEHPKGKHKALLFQKRLGITQSSCGAGTTGCRAGG